MNEGKPPSSIFNPPSLLRKWASFVRFSHTVFALPFALAAMAVAARDNRGWPGWRIFLLILAAMVCARTCAMAFNRIADREFDAPNPRTAGRHLPTGQISLASAWRCAFVSARDWSPPAIFSIRLLLSFAGGAGGRLFLFADETVHGFHACFSRHRAGAGADRRVAGGERLRMFPSLEILQMATAARWRVVFWLVGFDIIYALQDYEFDKAHGLHSLVVAWGPKNALAAAFLAHMVMWGCCWRSGCSAGFLSRISSAGFHCRLPGAGTLAGAAPQLELDQPRVLPAQRAHQRGFFDRHRC